MVGRHLLSASLGCAVALACASAGAARQPPGDRAGLELADRSAAPRMLRRYAERPPQRSDAAWRRFQQDAPGAVALWDAATAGPVRIYGMSLPAPGCVASPRAAERFARDLFARHLALLAPGAAIDDFALVHNGVATGERTVSFRQLHQGMPVVGGQVSFRFKNDRLYLIGSEALPHVRAPQVDAIVARDARQAAERWTRERAQRVSSAGAVDGPMILPIVEEGRVAGYRTVVRVDVDGHAPRGRWASYLDARTLARVAREQTLRFAQATLLLDAPLRYPGSDRLTFPASYADVVLAGNDATTDEAGLMTFDGDGAALTALLKGTFVSVKNAAGAEASADFSLVPDGAVTWSAADDELTDAQLSAFVHAYRAKQYAAAIAPELAGWLDGKLAVNVNIDDQCNAFYDGVAINFYRASPACENTARTADVVFHELGHGVHHHAIVAGSGAFDAALSEGASDFFACSFTGDPAMGRGFFYGDDPLRHIDPEYGEAVWPDDISGDPHQTGLIVAGALWDLRKALIDSYGEAEGIATSEQLFYRALGHAADIPSMYVETLAADDDDGDLGNGTPNVCAIVEAFGRHGLRSIALTSPELSAEPPSNDGHRVDVTVDGLFEQCPNEAVESAQIVWRLRRLPSQEFTAPMAGGPAEFSGVIPSQDEGEVVVYRVELALETGWTMVFPQNPADPMYEMFVGDVTPIYCTGFESSPTDEGWKHGLSEGSPADGSDDWQAGPPQSGGAAGDPLEPFEGNAVYGNDIGGPFADGFYQPGSVNFALSPIIPVAEFPDARLHYRRWLNVEDGYFDQASIYVNGAVAWTNHSGSMYAGKAHRDREWRFHDVDLGPFANADGTVQIRFELASDDGVELGGWTLDDFCVVGYEGALPGSGECGNYRIDEGEQCDDGNLVPLDGCDSFCQEEIEQPLVEALPVTPIEGCGCRAAGASGRGAWAIALLAALAALHRRRVTARTCGGARSLRR